MLTDPIKNYGSIVGTLKQTNEEYNSFIKRQTISRYIKTSYPPDIESKTILEIADFEKAFLYRARKKDMNIIAVMGPQGRGKTNVIKFAMEFSKVLNAPFSWDRNLYIGEDTLIHRKHLASRHKFGEQVINDEAEFLNRPNSIQLRDLLWTLASGRDTGFHFWFIFPTTKDFNFDIIDAHGNWVIQVSYRDMEKKRIRYKIYFKVTFEDQFKGAEWVEYPYKGAVYQTDFLPKKQYDEYKRIKDKIYEMSHREDWYGEKKKLDSRIRKESEIPPPGNRNFFSQKKGRGYRIFHHIMVW